MTSVSAHYRKNAGTFTALVEGVPADRWSSPSPCAEWTARDVVRHCVQSSGVFLGFVGQELPAGVSVDDDPEGAWANARDAVQSALDDPAVAQAEFEGFTGRSSFERGVNRFIVPDLVIHSWDLARATGQDDRLDAEEVRFTRESLGQFDESMMRQPGVFGPALEAPPGADEQTQLLAFLGRQV
jgi:uncharacterized protein (TIGR03086 family)